VIGPFDYIAPTTLAGALEALSEFKTQATVLAGGTDLLLEMRRTSTAIPTMVVDICRISELKRVTEHHGAIDMGPLMTHTEIASSELLRGRAALLCSASSTVGSPQIRNQGTVGGNIMNGAPCADTVPPLIALGARVTLSSAGGDRELDLSDFYLQPYVTVARPEEVLTKIRFAPLPTGASGCFLKLGRRNAVAIARLSVAAVVVRDGDGAITDARIVPGSAFPTWQRATEAEKMMLGERPSTKLFAAAGRAASEAMTVATGRRWSTEYKEPVLAVLVRRALEWCVSSDRITKI
jgi:CO/xanthine dehydrogenase FAD-binding subunit